MALLHEINNGTERFSVADDGAIKFNNVYEFPVIAGSLNYVLKSNGAGGITWGAEAIGMEDWIIAGDTGATTTITNGDTVTIAGGTNVTTSESAGTVTINSTDQYVGTVTSITSGADSGTGTAITTSGTFTFTGGTNITTSVSGTTVTIDADLAGTVTGSGTATRVAFWSAGSAISSDADLYWDNTNKRLGIGTITPDYQLESRKSITYSDNIVDGDAQFSVASSASQRMTFGYDNVGNGFGYIKTGNQGLAYTPLYINPASGVAGGVSIGYQPSVAIPPSQGLLVQGNVGIGTATPSSVGVGGTPTVLQINNSSTSVAQLVLSNQSTADGAVPGVIDFASDALSGTEKRLAEIWATKGDASTSVATGSLSFATNNAGTLSERMRISSGSEIGIGTSGCKATLDIKPDNNGWEGGLLLQMDNANTGWNIHPERTNNALYIGYNADTSVTLANQTATARLVIEGAGNVGIGTTAPTSKLTVLGTSTAAYTL